MNDKDPERDALSAWLDENAVHLLRGVEDLDFDGPPLITGAVLIVRITDANAGDAETIRILTTPGLGSSARLGLLTWAVEP